MVLLKKLLLKIQNGEVSFSPKNNSPEALKDFQETSTRLIHAHNKNYINDLSALKDFRGGTGFVTNILTRGGLTFEGKQFLQQAEVEATTKPLQHTEDVVDIKPNFFGVGVNFNAIYKKWIKKN